MRYVPRLPLDGKVQADLDSRQAAASRQRAEHRLNVAAEWKKARQTHALKEVVATLRRMMGERERCMYCLDSHGTDIDHFWPKVPFPERMFSCPNLLLSCAECGRLKADTFPQVSGQPLLVNPTAEDPWQHLDFDPLTGNVVARFHPQRNEYSAKGVETVGLLQLDCREALAAGHQRTFRRLSGLVREALSQPAMSPDSLLASLCEADEHGLLSWCFLGNGQNEPPFSEFREHHPEAWARCACQLQSETPA
jgi:uncharacterized protein (TIGR02646 family)